MQIEGLMKEGKRPLEVKPQSYSPTWESYMAQGKLADENEQMTGNGGAVMLERSPRPSHGVSSRKAGSGASCAVEELVA